MDAPLSPLALSLRLLGRWGPFSLAVILGSLAAVQWAETLIPRSPDDEIITGSVKPAPLKPRTTRTIYSVLDDKPIVIRD